MELIKQVSTYNKKTKGNNTMNEYDTHSFELQQYADSLVDSVIELEKKNAELENECRELRNELIKMREVK